MNEWMFNDTPAYMDKWMGKDKKKMFYLTMHLTHFIYGYMVVKDHSDSEREREMFYLTTHSTHLVREETHCCHYMGYYFWTAARVLLYAPFQRQGST